MKRAEVETQINWIYVLIGSGVFLFVIFKFISVQRSASELNQAIAVRDSLESAVLSAYSSSQEESYLQINLGKLSATFSCEDGGIQVHEKIQPVDIGSAFAPKKLSSDSGSIFMKSISWQIPMNAGSIILLTSPADSYLLVRNPQNDYMIPLLKRILPEGTDISEVGEVESITSAIQRRKGKSVRIVYFNEEPPDSVKKMINTQVSVVKISSEKNSFGTVTYYTPTGHNTLAYFSDEMMAGAVLSENADEYSCSANKALNRLVGIINLSAQRAVMLSNFVESNVCKVSLQEAKNELLAYADFLSSPQILKPDSSTFSQLESHIQKISSRKSMMERNSCPTIY
ncbi:MAG: hypothetical protein QXJ50_03185 [Candidatus Woesearchaeota archaeon]